MKINGFEPVIHKYQHGAYVIFAAGVQYGPKMHDDGKWYSNSQEWATEAEAQAVIDRFRPQEAPDTGNPAWPYEIQVSP